MGFHIDPMAEAEREHSLAFAYRTLAAESRWRLVRWWCARKATENARRAYEWRGMGATLETTKSGLLAKEPAPPSAPIVSHRARDFSNPDSAFTDCRPACGATHLAAVAVNGGAVTCPACLALKGTA